MFSGERSMMRELKVRRGHRDKKEGKKRKELKKQNWNYK